MIRESTLAQAENNALVWYDENQTLSRFIIQSWLETCTGGDDELANN